MVLSVKIKSSVRNFLNIQTQVREAYRCMLTLMLRVSSAKKYKSRKEREKEERENEEI